MTSAGTNYEPPWLDINIDFFGDGAQSYYINREAFWPFVGWTGNFECIFQKNQLFGFLSLELLFICFYQNDILETYREVRPEILLRPSVTWILKGLSQF